MNTPPPVGAKGARGGQSTPLGTATPGTTRRPAVTRAPRAEVATASGASVPSVPVPVPVRPEAAAASAAIAPRRRRANAGATREAAHPVAPIVDAAALPVSVLPGAGPVTAAHLLRHGLATVADVLGYVPRAYDDLRAFTPLSDCGTKPEGAMVLVRGRVARVNVFPHRFLAVHLEDGRHRLVARWFRVPGGMARAYDKGQMVVLAGPLRAAAGGDLELLHPTNMTASFDAAEPGETPAAGLGIRPRYAQVPGVAGRVVERIVAAAVDRYADLLGDTLPPSTRERWRLPPVGEALRMIHRPERDATPAVLDALVAGRSQAHIRMSVEDLLVIQMGLARRRSQARARAGRPCEASTSEVFARVTRLLPFALTAAQVRSVGEIQGDMTGGRPMQRLLVGDVGSGKTAVAFAAAAQAGLSGGQTLLMVPTEILAEQHARTWEPLAARLGLRAALLTASTPRPRRESLLALARAGQIHILIGTQSLLADRVAFPDLRLAIIDEQHRFGVAQRARLRDRDDADTGSAPHLLVMTATPIPRTLAFTLYGDLDLSLLDEQPPGRKPVRTRVLQGAAGRREAEQHLRAAIAAGGRAFVVCPVREFSAREGGVTAVDRHRELERALAPARVGLVHGEMDAHTKDAALRAFAAGRLDVLVATTVIEVGIDVPQASLMVVEEADRFGLAQLHQLRGRVGRGGGEADCLLLTGGAGGVMEVEAGGGAAGAAAASSSGVGRLAVVASTNDGFRIAEADLEMRGCGDLFGVRQAGMPRLRFADLAGMGRLLELARDEATRISTEDPELARAEHQPLRRAVDTRWAAAQVFAEEAG